MPAAAVWRHAKLWETRRASHVSVAVSMMSVVLGTMVSQAAARLFFKCPNNCGRFIKDVDPTFIDAGKAGVRCSVERCPCGAGVCPQCHNLVEEEAMTTHRCPDGSSSRLQDDAATKLLMQKLGKGCPNCGMFITKNGTCQAWTGTHPPLSLPL